MTDLIAQMLGVFVVPVCFKPPCCSSTILISFWPWKRRRLSNRLSNKGIILYPTVNYYFMYLRCGCTMGAHLPLLVLHSRIICFLTLTRYLHLTVMISFWFEISRLTITDYAVSFPFAVGPWAGRNSSIDMGSIEVGRRVTQEVPPGVFWRSLLHLGLPQFLKFNISLGKDALFGVYIRKGLPPSHAQVHAPECRFHLHLHPNEPALDSS